MRLKLVSAFAIAAMVWLVSLGSGIQRAPIASADGPIGGVDPVTGTVFQTYGFGYVGFQPYTALTLSFLPPATPAFQILPIPVVTDGLGQAYVPLDILTLLGGDPSAAIAGAGYDPNQIAGLAGQISITWGYAPLPGGVASFRFDACDTVNCVDLVGTIYVLGQ